MGLAYAHEKLTGAVHALATGPGPINERLADAFVIHLVHVQPKDDLPEHLRTDFERLLGRVTTHGPELEGEGQIHASVRAMTQDEAVEVAREIMRLRAEVSSQRNADRAGGPHRIR